jgi:hypothetical protein
MLALLSSSGAIGAGNGSASKGGDIAGIQELTSSESQVGVGGGCSDSVTSAGTRRTWLTISVTSGTSDCNFSRVSWIGHTVSVCAAGSAIVSYALVKTGSGQDWPTGVTQKSVGSGLTGVGDYSGPVIASTHISVQALSTTVRESFNFVVVTTVAGNSVRVSWADLGAGHIGESVNVLVGGEGAADLVGDSSGGGGIDRTHLGGGGQVSNSCSIAHEIKTGFCGGGSGGSGQATSSD